MSKARESFELEEKTDVHPRNVLAATPRTVRSGNLYDNDDPLNWDARRREQLLRQTAWDDDAWDTTGISLRPRRPRSLALGTQSEFTKSGRARRRR